MMKDNLNCRGTYKKKEFEKYYQSLLSYLEDYTLLFEPLSENNNTNVPALRNTDYSLLNIMSLHIHPEYFKQVNSQISHDTYTTILEFIERFRAIINSHHEVYCLKQVYDPKTMLLIALKSTALYPQILD